MEDAILTLLQKIKAEPERYLGRKSLNDLYFYILGYAHRDFELTQNYSTFFTRFKNFVHQKYNVLTDSLNWVEIISFYSFSEEEAFDNFYKNLNEFKNVQDE